MPKSQRTLETQCTIIAKVRDFSNVSIHNPRREPKSESVDYDVSCCYFAYHYPVTVYPNGHDGLNEGYVSVVFRAETSLRGWRFWHGKRFELTGLISVVDVEGRRRFQSSLEALGDFPKPDCDPTFVYDRYLSRRALLDEELLGPDDTLTLHMDIRLVETHYREPYSDDIVELAEFVNDFPSVYRGRFDDLPVYYFALSSAIAEQRLDPESSDYILRMRVTPMVKRFLAYYRQRPVPPDEDYDRSTPRGRVLVSPPSSAVDFNRPGTGPSRRKGRGKRLWLHYCRNYFDISLLADARDDQRLQAECRCVDDFDLEEIEKPSLPYKEHPKHVTVGSLLFSGAAAIVFGSLNEILDLLSTAHNCHSSAPTLRDTCLCWLRVCLRLESFVYGTFTWEDHNRVRRYCSLRGILSDRCGRKVMAGWSRLGLTLQDTEREFCQMALRRSFGKRVFRKKSKMMGRGQEDWHDILSLIATPKVEKWTCVQIFSGNDCSSYSLLFRYRLDAADDCGSTENEEEDISSFNFYS